MYSYFIAVYMCCIYYTSRPEFTVHEKYAHNMFWVLHIDQTLKNDFISRFEHFIMLRVYCSTLSKTTTRSDNFKIKIFSKVTVHHYICNKDSLYKKYIINVRILIFIFPYYIFTFIFRFIYLYIFSIVF